jgi:hypothetical protein
MDLTESWSVEDEISKVLIAVELVNNTKDKCHGNEKWEGNARGLNMKEQPEREEIGMTERKMMEWSLGSININLENIVRIPVNGQWSVVRSQWSEVSGQKSVVT